MGGKGQGMIVFFKLVLDFFSAIFGKLKLFFFSFSHFVLIRRGFDWFGLIAG